MSNIIQNLGKIVPNHRGAFSDSVQYFVLDEVFFFGASYRVVTTPPIGTAPTDTNFWVKVTESSAKLVNVFVTDTTIDGRVSLRFAYEDLTYYDVTTGPLKPTYANSDWESTSGETEILNKPSFGNAAFATIGNNAGNVAAGNHTHALATTTVAGFMSAPDKVKLNGIATGATANQTDSYLRNRANHTGSQAISTITGLQVNLNSKVNTSSVGVADGIASLNDKGKLPQSQGGGQPVISISLTGNDLNPTQLRTALNHNGFYKIATLDGEPTPFPGVWATSTGLSQGVVEGYVSAQSNYTVCYQIIAGTSGNRWYRKATSPTTWSSFVEITSATLATTSVAGLMSSEDKVKLNGIATGATANQTDSYLRNRTNHTGSQAISTITGLQTALNDKISISANQYIGGIKQFNSSGFVGSSVPDRASLVVSNNVTGSAGFMEFRSDSYSGYLGIDPDGKLKFGGGTFGNESYEILHTGNYDYAGYLSIDGGVIGSVVVGRPNHGLGFGTHYLGIISQDLDQTLSYSASIRHRWRIGGSTLNDGSVYMTLTNTALNVSGNINATGNLSAYSDERLKSNIETIDKALDLVNNLRGVRYTKDGINSVGVIAQEIQKYLPEVVSKPEDSEYLTVAYGNIVGVLIEAIKELKEEIEELKRTN